MKKNNRNIRKLILIISGAALMTLIAVIAIRQYYILKQPVSKTISAVPVNAALIVQCKAPDEKWEKISGSPLWNELCGIPEISRATRDIRYIDSLVRASSPAKDIWAEEEICISMHNMKTGPEFLFVIPVKKGGVQKAITRNISKWAEGFSEEIVDLYDTEIHNLQIHEKSRFSWAFSNGLFVASPSQELTELSLAALSENSGVSSGNFMELYKTKGSEALANVFLNGKGVYEAIKHWDRDPKGNNFSFLYEYANWMAFDLTIQDEMVRLNGFSTLPETKSEWFKSLLTQEPAEMTTASIIPLSCSFYFSLNLSDINTYLLADEKYRQQYPDWQGTANLLETAKRDYGVDLKSELTAWAENEICLFSYDNLPMDSMADGNLLIIVRSRDTVTARQSLENLVRQVNGPETDNNRFDFNGFPIFTLEIEGALPAVYGNLCGSMKYTCFTFINEYVIFANNEIALRRLILDYLMENTLARNLNYSRFTEYFSTNSTMVFYSNFSRNAERISAIGSQNFYKLFQSSFPESDRLGSIAVQISSNGKMFYNNIVIKLSAQTESKPKMVKSFVWEFSADTLLTGKPEIIKYPASGELAFLVEDVSGQLYFVGSDGVLQWKYKKQGLINSSVFQVDKFKSRKYQLLFSTPEGIYCIDKKGNDVEGFPVLPEKNPIGPVAVFDYESKKDYRLIFADAGHVVQNFSMSGKQTEGWKVPTLNNISTKAAQHFRTGSKDYIVITDFSGEVYLLNRRGEKEKEIKAHFATSESNTFYYIKGKTPRICTTDSTGKVYFLKFDGSVETLTFKDFSKSHYFLYEDITGDKESEYIFADKREICVFNDKGAIVLKRTMNNDISADPAIYNFGATDKRIGLYTKTSREVFLINNEGAISRGFPEFATGKFTITDVDKNGDLDMVLLRNSKLIAIKLLQ
ncbi:MAG: hypothetical protein KKA07_18395 [Bacteroidetes bacterium]|nr:hypothetical protein [Bacteroidota bacterium]MBU1721042.1 hypothetical protein [Bacteroidota bacterium]